MFDQEIEALRDKRIRLIRKIVWGAIYSALALWALWLVYIAIQRQEPVVVDTNTSLTLNPLSANTLVGTTTASEDIVATRKAFQQQLVIFDTEYSTAFSHADFLQWLAGNNKLSDKEAIKSNKQKALTLFATSAYQEAMSELKQTSDMAKALEQSWHQAYENKLQQAQQAYDNENIKSAELYINQALAVKPKEPRGVSLQQQISRYPRVAILLQTLNVAKIENNLPKQSETLQLILAEDNTRIELAEELKRVTQQLNDRAFSLAINEGVKAIEQQNIAQAQAAYQRAKSVYPQREEVRSLQKKIAQQQTSNNLQAALKQVTKAEQADDWQRVLTITNDINSANAELKAYQQTAKTILRAQNTAKNYLAKPERLQDQQVRAQAQTFVSDHIAITLKSPTFANQLKQLSGKIEAASRQQEVNISSDGKTDIWVLSVGHVGEIKEKTIRLRPGNYTLEGRCTGYRNKQIAITVSTNTTTTPIYLVCDERI